MSERVRLARIRFYAEEETAREKEEARKRAAESAYPDSDPFPDVSPRVESLQENVYPK